MLVGAVFFSFMVGMISSVTQFEDKRMEIFYNKVATLDSMKNRFKLSDKVYQNLYSFFKHESKFKNEEFDCKDFLNDLPLH